jgi:hypothetical protein
MGQNEAAPTKAQLAKRAKVAQQMIGKLEPGLVERKIHLT